MPPSPAGHSPPYWTSGTVIVNWDYAPDIPTAGSYTFYLNFSYHDPSTNVSGGMWSNYAMQSKGACPCGGDFSFDFTAAPATGQGRVSFTVQGKYENGALPGGTLASHPSNAGWDPATPIVSVSVTNPGGFWKSTRNLGIDYFSGDVVGLKRSELRRCPSSDNASCSSPGVILRQHPPSAKSGSFTDVVPADGIFIYTMEGWDEAGGSSASVTKVGVDTTAPSASIGPLSPYWRGSASASLPYSTSDPQGVTQVRLYSSNRADNITGWTGWALEATTTSASGSFAVTLPGNLHTKFGIIARDGLGNEHATRVESPSAMAAYDTGAPGGTINTAGYWKSDRTFTLSYAAADNMASDGSLRNLTLWERPKPANGTCGAKTMVVASSTVFSGPATRTVSADGWYCYTMYVNDKAGNGNIVQQTVAIDTGSPNAAASTASPYWTAGSAQVHFEGADLFEGRSDVSLDLVSLENRRSPDNATQGTWGEEDRSIYPPASKNFSWVTVTEGFYSFRAKAFDRAGNVAYSGVVLLGYDAAPPSVNLSANRYWQTSPIDLTVTAGDSLQLREYRIWYSRSADNATWGAETSVANGTLSGTSATLPLSLPVPSDGFYRFRAVVGDQAGQSEDAVLFIGADGTSPVTSIKDSYGGYWIGPDPDLQIGVTDAGNVSRLALYERKSVDNSTWDQWREVVNRTQPPFNWTHPHGPLEQGWYRFAAVALDQAGNSGPLVSQLEVGVDYSLPGLKLVSGRYWQRGPFNVSLSAYDTLALHELTVDSDFSPDNQSWGNTTRLLTQKLSGKQISVDYPASPAADGFYRYTMAVWDWKGSVAAESVLFGYDRVPPRTGLSGLGNYTSSSSFGIAAISDDKLSGLAELELWYRKDGASWIRYASLPNTTVYFDTSSTGGDGKYEFRAVGIDRAANVEAKTSVDITTIVDTRPPAIASRSPDADETNVPVNAAVRIGFDEAVRQEGAFAISDAAGIIPSGVEWSADGKLVTISAKRLLDPVARHEIKVEEVQDLAGNLMAEAKWAFTTGQVPATIVTTDPLNGSSAPLGNVEVRFTFSKPMEAETAKAVGTDRGKVVSSDLAGANLRVVFEFVSAGSTRIHIDSSKAKDASGMLLDGDRDGAPGGDFVLFLEVVPGAGSVRGTVRSTGGAGLEGATVSLEMNGSLVAANRSGPSGEFSIVGLAPGNYRLTAVKTGYLPYVTDVKVDAGKESVVDVTLISETDFAARFPGGALGLGATLGLLFIVLAVAVLFVLRRQRRASKSTAAGDAAPRVEKTGEAATDVEEKRDAPELTKRDTNDAEPATSGRNEVARRRSFASTPPSPPARADREWREVERPAAQEIASVDVEMESRVIHAGIAVPRAQRTDFGCPVCGHLVRAEEGECPGCGAEVKW
ncbi:MAG TPA: Ig-like domain-containing protein [Thermoplasmata archaeon]|nr:Ig-like domain-containing protein [Thermoplasmata archaeon]